MRLSINKIPGRQHLCCLLLFFISCTSTVEKDRSGVAITDSLTKSEHQKKVFTKIVEVEKTVHSGDLILRTGRDFTSDIMKRVSKTDTTYSHCGIASWENDTLFVYHALGGEWNPDEKIRRDPFPIFCNPHENRGFGIYRYTLNDINTSKLVKNAQELATYVLFDNKFDLGSNDRMYCSEYVYKCLENTIGADIQLPVSSYKTINYISIDNLFINSIAKEITRMRY